LAQGFVFAEENFFTASVPADIKTKTLSLETDPSYFWSSKYYIKDGETSLSNIYAKQKGDISVKCPVMQQKNAGVAALFGNRTSFVFCRKDSRTNPKSCKEKSAWCF
jgi:hypothetical protein